MRHALARLLAWFKRFLDWFKEWRATRNLVGEPLRAELIIHIRQDWSSVRAISKVPLDNKEFERFVQVCLWNVVEVANSRGVHIPVLEQAMGRPTPPPPK